MRVTINFAQDGGRTSLDDRENLRQRFNRAFGNWDIELPADAMKPGIVWLIVQQGWTIWTRFNTDIEDERAHLDYYAMHRMTNDRHVRLYAGGEGESLPAIESCLIYPADATKGEVEALEAEQNSRNRAVEEMLDAKGFVMTADAHPSAQVNRYLIMHPEENDTDRE